MGINFPGIIAVIKTIIIIETIILINIIIVMIIVVTAIGRGSMKDYPACLSIIRFRFYFPTFP